MNDWVKQIELLRVENEGLRERVRELEDFRNFRTKRIVELESALTDWKHKVIQLTLRNRGLREALEWVQARYDIYTPDDVKQKVDKALEVRP